LRFFSHFFEKGGKDFSQTFSPVLFLGLSLEPWNPSIIADPFGDDLIFYTIKGGLEPAFVGPAGWINTCSGQADMVSFLFIS
jgi:hypothetical protein